MMKNQVKKTDDCWYCEDCGYDGTLSGLNGYLCCWSMDMEYLAECYPTCIQVKRLNKED